MSKLSFSNLSMRTYLKTEGVVPDDGDPDILNDSNLGFRERKELYCAASRETPKVTHLTGMI